MQRRVALLCQHFYPEMISTGIHVSELSFRLSERGWKVSVFTAQPTLEYEKSDNVPVSRVIEHKGVRIIRVRTLGAHSTGLGARALFAITYVWSCMWHLLRDARTFDVALVTTNPPFIGIVGTLLRRIRGLPFVLLVHDVYPDILERLNLVKRTSPVYRLWDAVTSWILESARTIIVLGRDMDALIKSKMKRAQHSKVHIIPNWADDRAVNPVAHSENPFRHKHELNGQLLIQYSGRMGTTHNLEPLVEASALMKDEPVRFQLIGDGAKKQALRELVETRGLTNVEILPYQPFEQLGTVISAADIAVVCLESRFTGVSVPSKSYGIMAAGRPILGFLDRKSEIGMTITENDCGVVLEDPTPEDVAGALRSLIADPERLRAMGENSRKAFLGKYSLTIATDLYENVLLDSIGGPT